MNFQVSFASKSQSKLKKDFSVQDSNLIEPVRFSIRSFHQCQNELGLFFQPGELQRLDINRVLKLVHHPQFLIRVFKEHFDKFQYSECVIYQSQARLRSGMFFVYGTFITDSKNNLIDIAIDTDKAEKRKKVLMMHIHNVCTKSSILNKFH